MLLQRLALRAALACLVLGSPAAFARPSGIDGRPGRPRGPLAWILAGTPVQPDQLVQLARCPTQACTLSLADRTGLHVTLTLPF